MVLPPSHKICHAFLFSLTHKRFHISIFGKSFLLYEYKNYTFSLYLTRKTKSLKIPCHPTSLLWEGGSKKSKKIFEVQLHVEETVDRSTLPNLYTPTIATILWFDGVLFPLILFLTMFLVLLFPFTIIMSIFLYMVAHHPSKNIHYGKASYLVEIAMD